MQLGRLPGVNTGKWRLASAVLVSAQRRPEMLGGVELGQVGGQEQQLPAGRFPARTVEDEHKLFVWIGACPTA